MMCSGPFSGAQDTPSCRRAQREGATWIGSLANWRLEAIIPINDSKSYIWGWDWGPLGSTGLVLSSAFQNYTFATGAGAWVLLGSTGLARRPRDPAWW